MSKRPVPYVLLHVSDPVDDRRASRDFVALPLTRDVLERIGQQCLTWLRISNEHRVSGMKFDLPEALWFEGFHPERGWMPSEFAGDPSWAKEFDVEAEIPAVVRQIVEQQVALAFADEGVLDVMDTSNATSAQLVFEDDEMRIEVGPGAVVARVLSEPLPESALLWGGLYWGVAQRPDTLFDTLVRADPVMALDLIEHGFVVEGAEGATRLPFGPVAPSALAPLLEHGGREIRTRAVLLTARASDVPARREGGRSRG